MTLGRIARGLGKVGILIEAAAYVATGMRALVKAVKGDPIAQREGGAQQGAPPDIASEHRGQDSGPSEGA